MRRILPIIAVLLILIACAVPAFALGNGTGTTIYSPLQFDEWYSDLDGGPVEWVGNYYNDRTSGTGSYYFDINASSSTGVGYTSGYAYISSNTYELNLYSAGTEFTLVANNKLQRIADANGAYFGLDNGRFKTIRVHGAYLIFRYDANGQIAVIRQNFDRTFDMGTNYVANISLGQYLTTVLEPMTGYYATAMFFEDLSFEFTVEMNDTLNTPHFVYTYSRSAGSSVIYDFRSWVNLQLDEFDTSSKPPVAVGDFEIGTFLGNSVDAFLGTPIFGDYTLSDVLGVVLVLAVLMFALKMLV